MDISRFNDFGDACSQAEAVLAFLNGFDGIEASWDGDKYATDLALSRFDNCREQGYILHDRKSGLCVVWYEHRNSDQICVSSFRAAPDVTPDAETWFKWMADEGKEDDKYSMVDHYFGYGNVGEAAHCIYDLFEAEY